VFELDDQAGGSADTKTKLSPAPDSRATESSAPDQLYDSVRDIFYVKPALRGWMHLLWFEASLVLGTLLIYRVHGARHVVAATIFASTVAGLFGASALYHRGNWGPTWSARLQQLDHSMIFLVIAGTATPVFLLAAPGAFGIVGLVAMWSLTAVALSIHLFWMDAPEMLVGGAFIGLGAIGSAAIPEVWIHVGIAPAVLLIAGSLIHVTGAISYHRRWLDPRPAVFGYHEVFHTYVCVAAACQYVAIAVFIL
jgi:hemolysin III